MSGGDGGALSRSTRWLRLMPTSRDSVRTVTARPFLKWAGGKSQLLPELVTRSPHRIDTYYEPFLGGGALFFALREDPERAPKRAVLNDLNHELITTYEVVRDAPDRLIRRLRRLEGEYLAADDATREALYYEMRERHRLRKPVEVAARLIFLNKTCYNGLFRMNRKGEFNVPFGRYKSPRILRPRGAPRGLASTAGGRAAAPGLRGGVRRCRAGRLRLLRPAVSPPVRDLEFHFIHGTRLWTGRTDTTEALHRQPDGAGSVRVAVELAASMDLRRVRVRRLSHRGGAGAPRHQLTRRPAWARSANWW